MGKQGGTGLLFRGGVDSGAEEVGEVADKPVGGLVGDCDPEIGLYLIAESDHPLVRDGSANRPRGAAAVVSVGEGRPVWRGAVAPVSLLGMVGGVEIHEPEVSSGERAEVTQVGGIPEDAPLVETREPEADVGGWQGFHPHFKASIVGGVFDAVGLAVYAFAGLNRAGGDGIRRSRQGDRSLSFPGQGVFAPGHQGTPAHCHRCGWCTLRSGLRRESALIPGCDIRPAGGAHEVGKGRVRHPEGNAAEASADGRKWYLAGLQRPRGTGRCLGISGCRGSCPRGGTREGDHGAK